MAKQSWVDGLFENRGWTGLVQQDPTTGALEVGGVPITGTISVTIAQFLVLDPADYIGATLLVEDIPVAQSSYNGVEVAANAAGTGWIWLQTPSFTRAAVPTAAQASGWRIFVSDIGARGSFWYSNGTRYNLDQESVVLSSPILSSVVLTNTLTSYTVAKQYEIPQIDGKCIWGDSDILEIQQIANKTGTADVLNNAVYLGKNIVAVDATETNTVITGGNVTSTATNRASSVLHRILRKSSTAVRIMNANAQTGISGTSTSADAADTTVTSLDSGPWYLDSVFRCSTSTGDSALTLTGHMIRLISSGGA